MSKARGSQNYNQGMDQGFLIPPYYLYLSCVLTYRILIGNNFGRFSFNSVSFVLYWICMVPDQTVFMVLFGIMARKK